MTKNGAIITAAIVGAAITGVFMIAAAFIQAPRNDATATPIPRQEKPQQQAPPQPKEGTLEVPGKTVAAPRLIRVADAAGQTISDGQTVIFRRERSRQFVTDGDLAVTLAGYPSGATAEIRWLVDGNEVQYRKGPTDGHPFVNELKGVVLDLTVPHAFTVLVGVNESSPSFARSFSVFGAPPEGR